MDKLEGVEIRHILREQIKVRHILREQNKVVDAMTKLNHDCAMDLVVFEESL